MSKKFNKSPQLIPNRAINQTNQQKKSQLKHVVSPVKKATINNLKNTINKKNPSSISLKSKITNENNSQLDEIRINESKNHIQNTNIQNTNKRLKKNVEINKISQINKPFTKGSKVLTVKLISGKQIIEETEMSSLKKTKDSIQGKNSLSLQANEFSQKSNLQTISTLKSQIQQLMNQNQQYKTQNHQLQKQTQQLKKQNQKLVKKIQKWKNLSQENKRLLKQRIQSFNFQGQNLRKFKQQMNQKIKQIQTLNAQIEKYKQQTNVLKNDLAKLRIPKVEEQIQTQQVNLQQIIVNGMNSQSKGHTIKTDKLQNNYQTSSSRYSFGGILPLETVIKQLPQAKIKIEFKKSTQKHNIRQKPEQQNKTNHHHLLSKYDKYWSNKIHSNQNIQIKHSQTQEKLNKIQIGQENKQNLGLQQQTNVQSQILIVKKESSALQQNNKIFCTKNYNSFNQNILLRKNHSKTVDISYIDRKDKDKQLLQYNKINLTHDNRDFQRFQKYQSQQCLRPVKHSHKNISIDLQNGDVQNNRKQFSPTILIQNYKRISDQQQLIRSLYLVVDQLTKEVQTMEKKNNKLEMKYKNLERKYHDFIQNQGQPKQFIDGQFQANNIIKQEELINGQIYKQQILQKQQQVGNKIETYQHNQTMLLDESLQQRNKLIPQNLAKQNPQQICQQFAQQHSLIKHSQIHSNKLLKFNFKENNINKIKQKAIQRNCCSQSHIDQKMIIEDISRFVYSQNLHEFHKPLEWNIQGQQTMFNCENRQGNQIQGQQGKQEIQRDNIQKQQYCRQLIEKGQDSLQQLQYFSIETPQNYSSQVSCYKQQYINQNQRQRQKIKQNDINRAKSPIYQQILTVNQIKQQENNHSYTQQQKDSQSLVKQNDRQNQDVVQVKQQQNSELNQDSLQQSVKPLNSLIKQMVNYHNSQE